MDVSTSKQSAVDPVRLAKLFGVVIGSITLLAVIAVVGVAEWPLVTATLWHMRNGNNVELEGHLFRVPLLYEPESSKGGKQIDILQSPRLFSSGSSVTIESNSKVLDLGAASRWQSDLLGAIGTHRNDASRSTPLTLHGKKLTFVCVDIAVVGDSLLCHAVGTGLTISTSAPSPTQIRDTRAMIATSE